MYDDHGCFCCCVFLVIYHVLKKMGYFVAAISITGGGRGNDLLFCFDLFQLTNPICNRK